MELAYRCRPPGDTAQSASHFAVVICHFQPGLEQYAEDRREPSLSRVSGKPRKVPKKEELAIVAGCIFSAINDYLQQEARRPLLSWVTGFSSGSAGKIRTYNQSVSSCTTGLSPRLTQSLKGVSNGASRFRRALPFLRVAWIFAALGGIPRRYGERVRRP